MTTVMPLTKSDVPDSVSEMMHVAQFLQTASVLPAHLRNDPANLFAMMLRARSLDIPMLTAFDNVVVQDGKTGLSAALMQALIIRAGFGLYQTHRDDTQATVRAERPGIGPNQEGYAFETFTLEDARQGGLISISSTGQVRARTIQDDRLAWEKWTKNMLVWRAISNAAKFYFSDVLLGMVHTPDELGAEVDEQGRPVAPVRTSISAEVDPQVKQTLLRIGRIETAAKLKALYDELQAAGTLSTITPNGLTLSQVIADRKAALTQRRKTRAERKNAPAEPPVTTAEEVGPGDDEAGYPAQPAGQEDSSTPLISEQAPQNPESSFDALQPSAPADPDTADTPRRDAVLKIAAEHFGGAAAAVAAAYAHFGRELGTVGTTELQHWLTTQKEAE